MRLFRVHVDRWYTVPRYGDFLEACIVLVLADTPDEAKGIAMKAAEGGASCSYKLAGLEFRSTVPVETPSEVVGGARFVTPQPFRDLPIPRRVRARSEIKPNSTEESHG